jgi:putative copper resistance protein D
MSAASLLQLGSVVLLNAGFAWIVGTLFARFWLRGRAAGPTDRRVFPALHRTELQAVGLCLVAQVGAVWAAAAVMMGDSLTAAGSMLWMTVSQTAYGHAALVGVVILVAIGGLGAISWKSPGVDATIVVLLLGFAAIRASVSHAGDNGMFTFGLLVEWVHLLVIALWLGGVAIGGWLVLPRTYAAAHDTAVINRYLEQLSRAATIALIGIFATGVYNALQRVGAFQNVMGNPYGTALLVKLAFVGLAVALGGYNKLVGFPSLMKSSSASPRVITILRIESVLLLNALAAAAFLTTQQPPMAI